ncbi:MAG: M23 family metallopeptidase [Thermoanaerobaculia bacterium]
MRSFSTSTSSLRRKRRVRGWLLLLLALGLAIGGWGAWNAGPAPAIEILPKLPGIGRATAIEVAVAEPSRGLTSVKIELVQGEQRALLAEQSFRPRGPLDLFGARTERESFAVVAGKDSQAWLAPGEATVVVTAARAPGWLRAGEPAIAETRLPVRLSPPTLAVLSSQTYVAPGGAETVVYRVGPGSARDGVAVGDLFFPGHPLPGGTAGERFALFALPFDAADAAAARLVAADEIGNQASTAFVDRFMPRPPREDTIDLEDAFLDRVVAEIRSATPDLPDKGGALANYLEINRDLRRRNAAELIAIAAKSREEFLWREPFLPLPGGKVMSSFADRRAYRYRGQIVDHQVHLGFDLASVQHAPIPASNRGVVVLARYFGIYGNAVVVDHGYGLASLYAHLSSLGVTEGDRVERGQILGRSGATGLAGGDHLHFSFLVDGVPVSPLEWWDPHWIADRIGRKLGPALPFAAGH